MVRESMVTICQGMHSNLGDLPLILFFYVFPKRIIIFSHMHRLKKIYIYNKKNDVCFPIQVSQNTLLKYQNKKQFLFHEIKNGNIFIFTYYHQL